MAVRRARCSELSLRLQDGMRRVTYGWIDDSVWLFVVAKLSIYFQWGG